MNFQGECSISLENCDWKGDYDPVKNITALNSNQSEITIRDCYFSTKNARAIKNCNTLNIERSHFLLCGNHEMHGGAIAHLYGERKIENCTFDRCFGGYGGAIFAMDIYGISNCEFISCESRSLKEDGAQDIAVIAIRNTENNILDSCVFRHTSVSVGNSISGRGRYIASNCNFIKGSLYFHLSDNHVFGGKSKFDGGRVIEKYFDIDEEGIEELLMTE